MDVLWGDASIQNIQQTDYAINNNINVQWQVGVCYRAEEDQAHMLQNINNSINTTENLNLYKYNVNRNTRSVCNPWAPSG